MLEWLRHKKSESLMKKGEEAFAEGEVETALKFCERMIGRGYSGGWELKALILASRGKPQEAHQTLLEHLHLHRAASEGKTLRQAELLHVRLLVRAGLFEQLDEHTLESSVSLENELLGVAADECLKSGFRERGRGYALGLAQLDHDEQDAFWYIREADNIYSQDTTMFKITVGGESTLNGRYTCVPYHVAADDIEAALVFVREVEPVIPDLALVEIRTQNLQAELPHGVYWRGPWISGSGPEIP